MASKPPSNRRMVGVSTKLYFSAAKTSSYIDAVVSRMQSIPRPVLENVDIFLIPDLLTLSSCISQLGKSTLAVPILPGAQDTFWEDSGAYTGAISPAVLKELGVRLVEIGHAERRRLFSETDEQVALKAAAVVRNGMVPLVCVGEQAGPREGLSDRSTALDAVRVVESQVQAVMAAVDDIDEGAEIVIAYEPVWAIGAAEPAGAGHIIAVAEGLRVAECVRRRKGLTRIIYGGSAGPGLFTQLKGAVDGLFLGRFAHDPEQFCCTIQEVSTA